MHGLLPATHICGCPGRTTTDSLHLLTDYIKAAWRKKKVVSALILDVEGAFLNAVTHRLLHNMRQHRVPEAYVSFVSTMVTGRKARLKFDDYISNWFLLDNGIGQGDPLSMLLYLFYNADILDVAKGPDDMSLGYIDDIALVVTAKTFTQMHRSLSHMMLRRKGGFHWSKLHNSNFETSKSTLVNFSRSKSVDHPPPSHSAAPLSPHRSNTSSWVSWWIRSCDGSSMRHTQQPKQPSGCLPSGAWPAPPWGYAHV